MNQTKAYASEAQVGPPSELINVREFLAQCARCDINIGRSGAPRDPGAHILTADWSVLPDEERREVEEECRVNDLATTLNTTISNPYLYVYVAQNHEDTINVIYAAAKQGAALNPKSRKRKRTELATGTPPLPHDVLQLQNNFDNIQLRSWPYSVDSASFIRPQKNSDLNVLTNLRKSNSLGADSDGVKNSDDSRAILVVSVYNRLSWGNFLSRSSQHAVLSSQTIGDLYDVIPCSSNEIPVEKRDIEGELTNYHNTRESSHKGCVVCIENIAYGDGQENEDYSDKLMKQLESMPENKRNQICKGPAMHDQKFDELTLRVNQPYWLMHQGSCEHFLVIDEIRLCHPFDPDDGYPLTLHITPPILDLCQACSRVPAVLSVIGDIRLGQSPCKLCSPCWRLMGGPLEGDEVLVVSLPEYEHGW